MNAAKNATVNVDIQQPLGQDGLSANSITLPSSALSINAGGVQEIATQGQVGTAALTTPLLGSTPVPGVVTVGGTATAPTMTLTFNLVGAKIAFTGNVTNLFSNPTVTFPNVPDVPFTDLSISLTGGANGLFNATCATGSSTASAAFTSQFSSTPDNPHPVGRRHHHQLPGPRGDDSGPDHHQAHDDHQRRPRSRR